MEIPKEMTAAVLTAPNKLELKTVEVPHPSNEDVLIRIEACAICKSDLSLINKPWPGQPPYGKFIPGHEYSGTVVKLGNSVDEFHIGDRVVVESHLGCMRCKNCRLGNYTACLNYGNLKKGHRANGFTTNGGYAQYVINHINTVYQIPQSMSFSEATLITNLGCVLFGFETIGGYIIGDKVAVIGPGPLGLISVQVAKILNARKVYLIGTRESRLNIGLEMGADHLININKEDPIQTIHNDTKGQNVDLVIEASGSEIGFDTAIKLTKKMGKILLLSFFNDPITADISSLGLDNKTVFAVRGEGRVNCERAVSLLELQKINLKPLITHSFLLEDIVEALRFYSNPRNDFIKIIITNN